MQTILGKKLDQSQKFLENGMRIPVTIVSVVPNPVTALKTTEKDGYQAVQLGFGTMKKANKALSGHIKKANLEQAPRVLREVRIVDGDVPELGSKVQVADVLKPGDIVTVTGVSKGKGWAGGVKRYGFKGGPRTHGQSDRERAPGSIGQTTTPGRVYKGKRMAGRMGQDTVSVSNLVVVGLDGETLYISGLVPGSKNSMITVTKTGEKKNFVPLYADKVETPEETGTDEAAIVESKTAPVTEDAKEVSSEVQPEQGIQASEEAGEPVVEPTTPPSAEQPIAEETPSEEKTDETGEAK